MVKHIFLTSKLICCRIMDRSWIHGTRFTTPYLKGVEDFMDVVRQNFRENQDILCPCRDCLNLQHHSQSVVEEHIQCAGMSNTYTRWIFHGESLSDDEGDKMEDVAYTTDGDDFDEDN
jgi:hypothetical protein